MNLKLKISIFLICSLFATRALTQTQSQLILTAEEIASIRSQSGTIPLFDKVLEETKAEVEAEIAAGIDVPVPKDMAGGYTHERHKKNYLIMQKAGDLFQITGDTIYAVYIRDMLLEYARQYSSWGIHPTDRSYATGKVFWQCLNDANWLVYVSQAYDSIDEWLDSKDKKKLEKDLLRPFAEFLSVETPHFFNRIHNHSTWGNAAVGMIGLVINDEELVQWALHGLGEDQIDADRKDNDGGLIKLPGQKQAGFLAQLDYSFSPDGYYTEGPYYQRYAMSPFILFSKSIEKYRPDIQIFSYRDSILKKAVYALLNLTDPQGLFFPFNDAQKGMSYRSRELVAAVDIVYFYCGNDPALLSVAQDQGQVLIDETGLAVAKGLSNRNLQPLPRKSIEFTDGAAGDEGGIGVLRSAGQADELCLVLKYSAQGMGHGHFDKLSFSLYDEGGEVVQDYGAARWVNILQKMGGRYLPENTSWAKQSIAHNTLVVDETSHFTGDFKTGNRHHSDRYFFGSDKNNVQVASAKDFFAYPSVAMHRTMVILQDESLRGPVVIDVFRAQSDSAHTYDLPLYFQGHLLSTDFEYKPELESQHPLGKAHGYQHIWKEAQGNATDENASLTWFSNGRFYSMTSLVSVGDDLVFARTGANDPNFNLRRDPAFIIRKKQEKDAIFVSVIEPHGSYNPVAEIADDPFGSIDSVKLLHNDDTYTIIGVEAQNGVSWTLMISNENASPDVEHEISVQGTPFRWKGPFEIIKN